MEINFEFIVENLVLPRFYNESSKRLKLVKFLLGDDSIPIPWREILDDLTTSQDHRSFTLSDYAPGGMIYWPSYKDGIVNAVGQIAIVEMQGKSPTLADLIRSSYWPMEEIKIIGEGPWCYWGEEDIFFYPSFQKLIAAYTKAEDQVEPNPEAAKKLLKKIGIEKVEAEAKKIASIKSSNAYESFEDFLLSIE